MSRKVIGWNALYLRKDSSSEFILTRSKRARNYACIGVLLVFVSLVLLLVLLSSVTLMEKEILKPHSMKISEDQGDRPQFLEKIFKIFEEAR